MVLSEPEGSPKRDSNIKWSYKVFNEERKKIKLVSEKHVIPREKVLKDLQKIKTMIILFGLAMLHF